MDLHNAVHELRNPPSLSWRVLAQEALLLLTVVVAALLV